MGIKKRHALWNSLIIASLIVCMLAFIIHYKNWVRLQDNSLQILSGIYYVNWNFQDISKVELVERLPSMERLNGFSACEREKGVYKDSLVGPQKIYVYVDNLKNPKIRLQRRDSLSLYLNLSDSLETIQVYELLSARLDSDRIQAEGK